MSFKHFCRPTTQSDLLFVDPTVKRHIEYYLKHKQRDSLVLYGPSGTGKSAMAEVILRERMSNCPGLIPAAATIEGGLLNNVSQIDGEFSNQLLANANFPLVVINEFDHMSAKLQQDVHSFWNKCSNIGGLILTTNNFYNVSPALRSRMSCLQIDCPPPKVFLPKAQAYLKKQNVSLADSAVLNVLNAASGDMRKMIGAVDKLAIAHNQQSKTKAAVKGSSSV